MLVWWKEVEKMSSRSRNKGLKFYTKLFLFCCIIGTILWYIVFASMQAKIIIPWVVVIVLFILWRRSKYFKQSDDVPKRRIKRYK
jgi:hypothetical protein